MTTKDDIEALEQRVNDLEEYYSSRIVKLEKNIQELDKELHNIKNYELYGLENRIDDLERKSA